MNSPIVTIKNMEKTFLGAGEPLTILKDLNLEIQTGSKTIILGASGSGKSTLIKTIVGLNKKDSGEIVKNIPSDKISYLSQNNMQDLNFPATAKEIIMTGVQIHKTLPFYKKSDYENFNEICKLLNITTDEVMFIGDTNIDIKTGKNAGVKTILLHKEDGSSSEYAIIHNTLQKDTTNSEKEAVEYIYRQLRNAEAPDEETARGIIEKLFFSDTRYSLGDVGRYRIAPIQVVSIYVIPGGFFVLVVVLILGYSSQNVIFIGMAQL